jgi:hypothetical protein
MGRRFTAVDRRAHCDDGRHKNATLSTRVKLLIVRNIAEVRYAEPVARSASRTDQMFD